jgi:hypothetical protein
MSFVNIMSSTVADLSLVHVLSEDGVALPKHVNVVSVLSYVYMTLCICLRLVNDYTFFRNARNKQLSYLLFI